MKLGDNISAVITGGASGLGAAAARSLAKKGVRTALFDLNEAEGTAFAKELGGMFIKTDISHPEQVAEAFQTARNAQGQERILVNCAGIAVGEKLAGRSRTTGAIRMHDPALFSKVIAINLTGSFLCAAHAAAGMMELPPSGDDGERGLIIHTSSVAAEDGQIGQTAYAASKGGIASMTLPMARDLAQEGIRVMSILPGFFETPIYDSLKPEVKENLEQQTLFPKRFGRPEEYGDFVVALCEHAYLNAETIRLDSGSRMPPR